MNLLRVLKDGAPQNLTKGEPTLFEEGVPFIARYIKPSHRRKEKIEKPSPCKILSRGEIWYLLRKGEFSK